MKKCPEHQTITPKYPINTDTFYTFPKNAFTQFPSNSACAWLINIPCNYSVIVHLKATIPDGGHVTITQTPRLNETKKFIKDIAVTSQFHPPSFDIFWYPGPTDDGNLKFSFQFQNNHDK
ncbi:Protein CBG24386 [Caenorhabditis briggsae]|uniref:Protein CBG24386 n=1 Tax=Caenorhabditis briggsae TaxID=6238 RepID=A8WKL4_CAEBR|nr:Protein CBG24386 [Caenorhabditis briggsae]CAP21009.1 Protein CBG24386 [Caenorhabditis briggsae]